MLQDTGTISDKSLMKFVMLHKLEERKWNITFISKNGKENSKGYTTLIKPVHFYTWIFILLSGINSIIKPEFRMVGTLPNNGWHKGIQRQDSTLLLARKNIQN